MTFKSFNELPPSEALCGLWKRQPVPRPEPDLELTRDSWIERGAEVVGWWIARLEHWLSEGGWLRAWLRLCLGLSVALAAAGLLLLPAVAKVLAEFAASTHWAASIVGHLMAVVTALPPVIISLAVAYLAYVVGRRIWLRRRGRHGFRHHDEYYQ